MLRVLDVFSGIGGFSLGLERAGMQTTAFCEIDPFCRKVLAKHWPDVPIHDDIRKLDGTQYAGTVDLVCGGYPCQPFSVAGKQLAEEDPRHLWPEMRRVIREARPRWVVAENVRGHVNLGFDQVASQLEDDGFTVWPFLVPACAVNAPHRRERLWIVGYSEHNGSSPAALAGGSDPASDDHQEGQEQACEPSGTGRPGSMPSMADAHSGSTVSVADRAGWETGAISDRRSENANLANTAGTGLPNWRSCKVESGRSHSEPERCSSGEPRLSHWTIEPDVGRVAHGVPARVDRLKSLGNAVVHQIPELIGRAILTYEQQLGLAA